MRRFFPAGIAVRVLLADLLSVFRLRLVHGIGRLLVVVRWPIGSLGGISHVDFSVDGTVLSTKEFLDLRLITAILVPREQSTHPMRERGRAPRKRVILFQLFLSVTLRSVLATRLSPLVLAHASA